MRARLSQAITEIFDKIYDGNLRTDFTESKNLVLLITDVNRNSYTIWINTILQLDQFRNALAMRQYIAAAYKHTIVPDSSGKWYQVA